MQPTSRRFFQSLRSLHHENPLGLPRSGTPPTWAKRPQRRKIAGVEKVIAVSSAKGGVGKSTVADNQLVPLTNYGVKTMSMGYLQVILDGSLIVTTPHTLATKDAVKGINMFKTVDVNILGLVQNMSLFKCPHCHGVTNVFGTNERVKRLCAEHEIDFLGDIPLHPNIGDDGERGKPTVVSEPDSDRATAFMDIARAICPKVGLQHG
ncbi:cytosolic Fe-S cluster assembling factor NBP35 [Purpureocillium lilacinum]|uniref:Cytosolic Fe-S cluster assembling factor NBP35 n=1 Tax=Purpureocillium lilacinum TaxID=33203 RepID=A0A179HVR5_PURLI|nr:cytosolic Fe-S cluster assembling factor NBP35 [Purpureocillium lilacinum]OAQ93480.1 cytosolic Fe-S cluster assembling factor NBP35 [Purpureocillium lilacinum]